MAITFWNNWNLKTEFILIDISFKEEAICFGIFGLGIVVVL